MGGVAIGAPLHGKVALRYHELESGLLACARVDEGVFRVIAAVLGVERREVFAWRAPRVPAAAFARMAVGAESPAPDAVVEHARLLPDEEPAPHPGSGAPDRVDAIFGTGS